jgi:cell division protein FtsN
MEVVLALLVVLVSVLYFVFVAKGSDAGIKSPAIDSNQINQKEPTPTGVPKRKEADTDSNQSKQKTANPTNAKATKKPADKVPSASPATQKHQKAQPEAPEIAPKRKKKPKKKSAKSDDDLDFLDEQIKLQAEQQAEEDAEKLKAEKAVLAEQAAAEEEAEKLKAEEAVLAREAEYTHLASAVYTHSDEHTEVVKIVKLYGESEGGGVNIYVPSLARERHVRLMKCLHHLFRRLIACSVP